MKHSSWPIHVIHRALSHNPYCVPNLLFRERVVVTDHGVLSHGRDKELVALLDGGINGQISGYFWYGHVLRVALTPEAILENTPDWAALIVPSEQFVDAPTVDLVFERLSYAMVTKAGYTPPFAQDPDDTFALRPTFDAACLALGEMIRRFNPKLRETQVFYDPPEPYGLDDFVEEYRDPPGHLDMRCMNIYGLSCSKDQNGGWPTRPQYRYPGEESDRGGQA
ncbi:MAG: hypothetical protein PHX24_02175 [Acidithiobacillus sp.]|nr:hypothetical protein [Acidithiobacillus sp.]